MVCEWEGDKLTAWVSTQGVYSAPRTWPAARIPPANVRVICQYMGGGFGSKLPAGAEAIDLRAAGEGSRRPVKVMLDRKEEHLVTGNRPSAFAQVKAGVTADGLHHRVSGRQLGHRRRRRRRRLPAPVHLLSHQQRRRTHKDVFINAGNQRPMRAPGHPQGCFLTEIVMDELADRVRMDPVEFRMKNSPPDAPNASGAPTCPRARRCSAGTSVTRPATRRPVRSRPAWASRSTRGAAAAAATQAHCDIDSDGSVVMKCGTQDIGTGTRTIVAIVTAETLGLQSTLITPEIGDTITRQRAALAAARPPAASARRCASRRQGTRRALRQGRSNARADAATLVAAGGRIHVKDNPSQGVAWSDACKVLGPQPISVDGQWEAGPLGGDLQRRAVHRSEVDIETGIMKVKRVLAIQDCGLVVDKLTAESQMYGGVIGSMNFALYEDRILDRVTGQMVNPNMELYLLAGLSDIPKVESS